MLGYLIGPLIALVGALPGVDRSAFLGQGALDALAVSLVAATVATLVDAFLGVPLGFWLSRTSSPARHVVTAAVLVPLALPPVVGGLVLLLWVGPGGWLGQLLAPLGLDPLNTLTGTILAQMFVAAPFVVISARAAFAGLDPALEDAARSLGCRLDQAFVRVLLPAARRGIATGLVLGWVRCLGEFGATAIVAYHPYSLPVLTFVRLTEDGLPTALPAGALLALVGSVAAGLLLWLDAERPRRVPGLSAELPKLDPAVPLAWITPTATPVRESVYVRALLPLGAFRLDVEVEAPPGVIAVLGSSGAGKSLFLRTIAGLVTPPTGLVSLAGQVLLDTTRGIDVPPEQRQFAYVAQRDALFSHLDVAANIGFGLAGWPAAIRRQRVDELVTAMGLERVRYAGVETLSGGERQRVSLARALAIAPKALLLDEPFSALDTAARREIRALVRDLHERTGLPIILVTHDRDDVFALADEVIILEEGKISQVGPLEEVFAHPSKRSIAHLLGIPNVLMVHVLQPASFGCVWAVTDWGPVLVRAPERENQAWELAVPADAVALDPAGTSARVISSRAGNTGWIIRVEPLPAGEPLEAAIPRDHARTRPAPGKICAVRIDGTRCHLMPTDRQAHHEIRPTSILSYPEEDQCTHLITKET
jgi:ABC-type sulfate/molybdate transport systems ATPase subunit/ABC-type sulfate transport system permease component